ncbi:MAG: response regulator transcription factor [Chloroflexi bacterium]|uniref:Response regulator transcription factor n=1 Tax=Candidatus Chlorohelix allophototropha TaxID=3003348 RepID=A0A8T7LYV0_9CHLR|nr:response regulator transcription factor [Chloroflexota bacterium]WJW66441.1 response regulator transcription factor [Chloroflexota bacterium L227-S17]
MVKILIADDEPDVVEVISVGLRMNSPDWEIISAEDGQMAVELFRKENPDLVILDMNMPRLGGLEACRSIRRENIDVPIIFLTVRDDEIEKVRGLEAGADDYITKPFSPLELMARIRAQLRRTMRSKTTAIKNMVEYQGLKIDFVTKNVTLDNQQVRLTSIEYNLLYLLASNPGQVVSHEYLLTKVWGPQYQDALEYLKVHIRHLREKLGDDAQNPRFIYTERSKGYRFTALPE